MPLAMSTFQSLRHQYFHVFELLTILNNLITVKELPWLISGTETFQCDYVDCLSLSVSVNALATLLEAFFNILLLTDTQNTEALVYPYCTCAHSEI